ncbi:MAG: hypothetical protein M3Y87_16815 [Myxococcota bacterium]|nr:hypothetical protein [Myxococcota bacterium]
MEVVIGFGGLILLIVVIGLVASSARGGQRKVLGDLAQANGLTYASEGVGHRIAGALDGRALTMTAQPGNGGVQEERWIVELHTKPPDGFGATKKRMLGGVSEGATRVLTGDGSFDGAVLAEARDVEGTRAYLTEARRAALLQLVAAGGILYDGKLMLHKPGLDTSSAKLRARVDMLRSIAAAID